jgi:hypothetical protein
MFTVYNVGMIYFDGCHVGQKRALIPDGREGDPTTTPPIPRHYASIFVGADKVDLDKTHWWWGSKFEREVTFLNERQERQTMRAYEFRIKEPSEVTFPDKRNGETAEFKDLEKLPRLQSDPGFRLATDPKTIARVIIRGGLLEARKLGDVPVVRWTVTDHANPIKITARDDDGNLFYIALKEQQTLYDEKVPYSDDITMVLSNTPDFIALMETAEDLAGSIANDKGHGNGNGAVHAPDAEPANGGVAPAPAGRHARGHAATKARQEGVANGPTAATPANGNGNGHDGHFDHATIYGQLNEGAKPVQLERKVSGTLKDAQLKQGYVTFLSASKRYRQSDCSPTCCPAPPPDPAPGGGGNGGGG